MVKKVRRKQQLVAILLTALATPVFSHRLVCRPGIDDPTNILKDALAPVVERLARLSLKRT